MQSAICASRCTGKERDTESGLDYMDARYYGSAMGRFMSPDPLGGRPEDPQTLNRYAYARNNPLSFSDPTGLDFNLTCTAAKNGSNGSTCQGGIHGTTTTVNGKSTFTATVITSASLSDPKSGNTATVNENGVQITTAQGTSGAKFIDNTPTADISGSGKFADFSFHIDGSCGGKCLDSGTFKFNGTPDQARDLLDKRGAFRSPVDWTIPGIGHSLDEEYFPEHKNTTQHRFGQDPSPHFSVPRDPNATIPTVGGFHVDTNAPGVRHLGCAVAGVACN
jgi:RHS repeat-associated protein